VHSAAASTPGLPSFALTQAGTDGEREARLVYYAFDLLHLEGRDVSALPLIERKALLEPLVAGKPGLPFNGHDRGDGELILKHRFASAATALGYLSVQSSPVRVSSCAWSLSMRAAIR